MTTVYKGNKANLYIASADKFIEMYSVTQSCELLSCVLLEARSGCCSFTSVSQSQVRSSSLLQYTC